MWTNIAEVIFDIGCLMKVNNLKVNAAVFV